MKIMCRSSNRELKMGVLNLFDGYPHAAIIPSHQLDDVEFRDTLTEMVGYENFIVSHYIRMVFFKTEAQLATFLLKFR